MVVPVPVDAAKASLSDPMVPRPFRVHGFRDESYDTFTLEIAPVGGDLPGDFVPGQFNMLYVFGAGESAISISGNPMQPERWIHTIRDVGVVTRRLARLRKGDVIGVRGPFGRGWPIDVAKGNDVVLIAGGIGLAPLRPVLYRLVAERKDFGRVSVLYGARTPQDILFAKELERWAKGKDLSVQITVDRSTPDWKGNVGVVTPLIRKAPFDHLDTVAMVCGPEVMMRFAVLELQKRDVADDRVFVAMERNMKCATGFCGHCQFGSTFICKDGPVYSYDKVQFWFAQREL